MVSGIPTQPAINKTRKTRNEKMSDENKSNPVQIPNVETEKTNPVEATPSIKSNIIRIQPKFDNTGNQSQNTPTQGKDFLLRAKTFEPLVDTILGTIVGIPSKAIEIKCWKIGLERNEARQLSEMIYPKPETRMSAKIAGARIAARHLENEELLDFAALGGFAAEMGMGFADVIAHLNRLEKTLNAQKAKAA